MSDDTLRVFINLGIFYFMAISLTFMYFYNKIYNKKLLKKCNKVAKAKVICTYGRQRTKVEFTDNGTVYRSECLSSPNGYVYKEDDIIEICYDENNKEVCFDNYAKLDNWGIKILGIYALMIDLFVIWLLIMS